MSLLFIFDRCEMKIKLETPHLTIFESELWRTTVSLIKEKNYLLLVDPNWLETDLNFIEEYIAKIKGDKKCYLLFTHSDYDHIIGYSKFKDYTCIASENFVNNPNKEATLLPALDFDDKFYIQRSHPLQYPKIDILISKEEHLLTIGDDEYIFYQAVGHNADGIITYNRTKGILILGDYLSNIEFPYIYTSVQGYKEVLDKLEKVILEEKVKYLIPGHGDYTTDHSEIEKRILNSRAYIALLEKHGSEDNLDPFKTFIEGYGFPKIMTAFHKGNVELWRMENSNSF